MNFIIWVCVVLCFTSMVNSTTPKGTTSAPKTSSVTKPQGSIRPTIRTNVQGTRKPSTVPLMVTSKTQNAILNRSYTHAISSLTTTSTATKGDYIVTPISTITTSTTAMAAKPAPTKPVGPTSASTTHIEARETTAFFTTAIPEESEEGITTDSTLPTTTEEDDSSASTAPTSVINATPTGSPPGQTNKTEQTIKTTTMQEEMTTPSTTTTTTTSKILIPPIERTHDEPKPKAAEIFFATFSAIFLVVIIVFGLIYVRRNNPRCIVKVVQQVVLRGSGGCLQVSQHVEMQDIKKGYVTKSVPKEEFAKHFQMLTEADEGSNTTEITEQFKQLALFSPPPPTTHPENYSAAANTYNRSKNRYINILPYDSTRVVLTPVSPKDPESDYINASFVKGASGQVEYIACQGPLADTAQDFWRMVFEKDVSVIAMVTHLAEKGKTKCYKYYPDLWETMRFEKIAVKCTQLADFPVHTKRTFIVQETNGAVLKYVTHLHFREWPDFGCPESTDLLITFSKAMRECALKSEDGLILVHCSAGVGRTGTLIALDVLTQEIATDKLINVFDTVLQLRFQRINMVQTEAQYKYIYECLRDVIEEQLSIEGVDDDDGPRSRATDPIYQNLQKSAKSSERLSRHSILTELEDIDEAKPEEKAVRISHYMETEIENELTEIVIPLTEKEPDDDEKSGDELACDSLIST